MSVQLSTIQQSDFTKLADVIWTETAMSVPQFAKDSGIFKVSDIPMNSGTTREFSEIDLEEYAKNITDGDQSEYAQIQQGYTKTMTKLRRSLNVAITYDMRAHNKYPEVINQLTNLAPTLLNRLDLDLSHRIGFATATSYTDLGGSSVDISTGDNLALASTAHTLRGSASTYRNILANNPRLSKGALEGMERLATEQVLNHFGEKKIVPFDILWTTDDPNTCNTAKEYLQSTADVDAAHEGVMNVYQSKYRHVKLPRVATDANGAVDTDKRYYWGLCSSRYFSAYLGMFENPHLRKPAQMNAGDDIDTDNWVYGGRIGYGITIVSARGFLISKGDGSA